MEWAPESAAQYDVSSLERPPQAQSARAAQRREQERAQSAFSLQQCLEVCCCEALVWPSPLSCTLLAPQLLPGARYESMWFQLLTWEAARCYLVHSCTVMQTDVSGGLLLPYLLMPCVS